MQIQYTSSYVENSKLVEYENEKHWDEQWSFMYKLDILALLLLVLHTYTRMVHHKEVPLGVF